MQSDIKCRRIGSYRVGEKRLTSTICKTLQIANDKFLLVKLPCVEIPYRAIIFFLYHFSGQNILSVADLHGVYSVIKFDINGLHI